MTSARADEPVPREGQSEAWAVVSNAFSSLGRFCIAADAGFRVVHASESLDELVGPGVAEAFRGRPLEGILGGDLFGAGAPMRRALVAGERREGWRGFLRTSAGTRMVSVTAAPLRRDPEGADRSEAVYILMIRLAGEDPETYSAPIVFGGLVARSPAMIRIARLIDDLQQSEATVLLSGQSGTGKEMVARAIHENSPRRYGPWVVVNCGALPADLLETELFGEVGGALPGVSHGREGRLELASHGTIFLDEIGDLPLGLQAKLLPVLASGEFDLAGESRTRTTDARFIAATRVDLRRAVAEGMFREDLYYLLRAVPIEIPPLSQRREDVGPLAVHLLSRVSARSSRPLRFSPEAMRALLQYPWPGNVRELENALEYAAAVCRRQTVLPKDLPPEIGTARPVLVPTGGVPGSQNEIAGGDDPEPDEREQLRRALEAHAWRRDATAKSLGMSRTTLWRKMREHRLLFR